MLKLLVLQAPAETGPFGFEPAVVFEDSDLVIVSKPPGVPVHATRRVVSHHLIGWLRATRGSGVALAHRLDRETSGLVVSTKNSQAARHLGSAFARGSISKEYLAVVFGVPPQSFVVDAPVGPDTRSAVHIKQAVRSRGGQPATTRFQRLQRFAGHALVLARPVTGRRHQIRVHLAHAGYPIVGDKLYAAGERHFLNFLSRGLSDAMVACLGAERQLLHAARLRFAHPRTNGPVDVSVPLPEDITAFLRRQGDARPS